MTTQDFESELFRGYDWHFDEVRRLKNLIAPVADPFDQDEYRKSLVVVLYAHFEGFCVFALQHYLLAVNRARIDCKSAVPAILAGSWEPVFNAMEHGDQKCRIFNRPLPNDERLHRHWRRRHFVEEMDRLLAEPVHMPEDAIDAESNLKPEVLQRNLFLCGLDHRFVDPHTETIHNLLGRRNRIAHGDERRGVPSIEYERYESAVFEICYRLIEFLTEAHANARYQKPAPYEG
jgi:hypothetical protein